MQTLVLPLRARPTSSAQRVLRRCLLPSAANRVERRCQASSPKSFHSSRTALEEDELMVVREPIRAAPEIDLKGDGRKSRGSDDSAPQVYRIVPASPSYFSTRPRFTDAYLQMHTLLQKYEKLPVVDQSEAPRIRWSKKEGLERVTGENIRPSRFKRMILVLQRLNLIHPDVMPPEVKGAIQSFGSYLDDEGTKAKKVELDEFGRARAIGRRKESTAVVYLVEGDGQVLINGKSLVQIFGRVHDRESALWPLKATSRMDKYNVFVLTSGGGVTGQAEAITLGIARALMIHEPLLKPALRKAGVVTRDPRKVERKKPGKRKARKMPAWVKR